jgi:UDP-N-acetylmuramyl tripeptide synthase
MSAAIGDSRSRTRSGGSGGGLFAAKVAIARAVGALSRRSGRGGGTTLPGRILLRTEPDALRRLATRLGGPRTVISATNGKTTTAGMLAAALHAAGRDPVHNRAGSNMAWGVATALIEGNGDEGLFEVDEAWLPRVVEDLSPTLLVLGNLFRDQLDRYGELERLADEWAATIAAREGRTGLVLNADDPLIADLGRDRDLRRRDGVTFFGIEDPGQAVAELQHAFDAKHCRRCGTPYRYERAFVGHLGHYSCPGCEADRPAPDVRATAIELRGIEGSSFTALTQRGELAIDLPLPGLYNVYNALAAIAAAERLEVPGELIRAGLGSVQAAFGRVETIAVGERALSILLIKNPAGANEVLRTLGLEAGRGAAGLDLWIALNDRIADGRDVSWIWDADFELLADSVRRVHCTGTRAAEIALRLKYAGWPTDRIEIADGIGASLDRALATAGDRLFALPTYTALIELRTLLARRGLAAEFWR